MTTEPTPEEVTALLNWAAGTGEQPAILPDLDDADLKAVKTALKRLAQRRSGFTASELIAAIDRIDQDPRPVQVTAYLASNEMRVSDPPNTKGTQMRQPLLITRDPEIIKSAREAGHTAATDIKVVEMATSRQWREATIVLVGYDAATDIDMQRFPRRSDVILIVTPNGDRATLQAVLSRLGMSYLLQLPEGGAHLRGVIARADGQKHAA